MNKITKILGIIVLIFLIVFLGNQFFNKSKNDSNLIKIGVVGAFSGQYTAFGLPMKKAVELAVSEFNQKEEVGGKKVELIVEDDLGDPKIAATAINKLINVDKLDYVISAQGSSMVLASIPIIQNNKKIFILTLASAPNLTLSSDYIFRSTPSDVYQAIKMNEFMEKNIKSNKVAGLYINNDYGVGIKKIINENKKVNNVANEMFDVSSSDFRSQLLKIKNSGADTLIVVAYNEFPIILKQFNDLKLNMRIITSETFKENKNLENSKQAAEGVFVASIGEQKDFVDFNKKYREKYSEAHSSYSAYAYDGANALLSAISLGGNIEKIKNNLSKINFNGATGHFEFSSDRERIGSEYVIYQVKNGQFVPLEN